MGNVLIGRLAGIPISVSPWLGLLVVYLVWMTDIATASAWILALVVSLVAHEMGHGLAAKRLGLNPEIVLHAFGGYCTHGGASTDRDDVKILLAGPALGLVFGLAALAIHTFAPVVQTVPILATFFRGMLIFGIFWNLANLLPIWPLDGGQLARLLALRLMKPARAERLVHGAALVLLLVCYQGYIRLPFGGRSSLLILLFLGIAWFNVRVLAGWASAGRVRTHNRYAVELMKSARARYAAADYREAARLCHQIRSESNVPPSLLTEIWKLLGLATYQNGNKKEAAAYLQRATLDAEVAGALVDSWLDSGDVDALDRLFESKEFQRIPASTRDPLIARARDL